MKAPTESTSGDSKALQPGKHFLDLLHREGTSSTRDAIEYFIHPTQKRPGCDEGQLGRWIFRIASRAHQESLPEHRKKKFSTVDLARAFEKFGLSPEQAIFAANHKPPTGPGANELRRTAEKARKLATDLNLLTGKLTPFDREYIRKHLPLELQDFRIIERFPSILENYALSLEPLAEQKHIPKEKGRPRKDSILDIRAEVNMLTSYVTSALERTSPPFKKLSTLLQAAYTSKHVAGANAKLPSIFSAPTLSKHYRRRHPRKR